MPSVIFGRHLGFSIIRKWAAPVDQLNLTHTLCKNLRLKKDLQTSGVTMNEDYDVIVLGTGLKVNPVCFGEFCFA